MSTSQVPNVNENPADFSPDKADRGMVADELSEPEISSVPATAIATALTVEPAAAEPSSNPESTVPACPATTLDGDYIGDLAYALTNNTAVPMSMARANIKTVVSAMLDRQVGFPNHEDLDIRHYSLQIAPHDWSALDPRAVNKAVKEIQAAITYIESKSSAGVWIPFEDSAARDRRIEFVNELAKSDDLHCAELQAHFKRDLLLPAVFGDHQITLDKVARAIAWTEYQLTLRKELWPEDAGGLVEFREQLFNFVIPEGVEAVAGHKNKGQFGYSRPNDRAFDSVG
jgi:hypothetical protein